MTHRHCVTVVKARGRGEPRWGTERRSTVSDLARVERSGGCLGWWTLALLLGGWLILGIACREAGDDAARTLVMAVETPPVTFDPRGPTNSETAHIQQLIFHTLVRTNERFEIVPELADRWEVDQAQRTYTFHLRSGITFHDGRELTARDVAYTFNSLIAPQFDSPKRAAFSKLDRVEAVDAHTVVFHCRERYPGLLVDLLAVGIIPEGSGETIAEHPIGTGPFRFERYIESQQVDVRAFPEAFGGGPGVDRLTIRIIRDPTTLSLELLSGTVQLAFNTRLSPDFVEEQRRSGALKVIIADGASIEYLVLNTTDPILSDRRVRQAIAYALDRRAIIESLFRGQAREAATILPPGHWAYHPGVRHYDYNPRRAEQLLDAAGYPDPDGPGPAPRFHLTLKTSSAEQAREVATIMQEQLRRVGIALDLQSFELQTYLNDLNRGQFQIGYLRLPGANRFVDIFKAAFGSRSIPFDPRVSERERTGFLNRARYRNPTLDELIAAAEATSDRQEQIRLYARIQEILAEDVPWIYLWYPANVAVMSPRVKNAHIPTSADFTFIKDLTLAP
ncbi:MAG: ABC transporter substrate-binding protein [Acidobacteria bacterium]|nr:MAG: ABC transporter substrate-binding protein [Acidobacteriota bacterium]